MCMVILMENGEAMVEVGWVLSSAESPSLFSFGRARLFRSSAEFCRRYWTSVDGLQVLEVFPSGVVELGTRG